MDAYYEAQSDYMGARRLAMGGSDQLRQIADDKRKARDQARAGLREIGITGVKRDGNEVTVTFEDGSQNTYEYNP